MTKKWEELTQAEKIEDLRRDVLRIFAALRDLDDRVQRQAHHESTAFQELTRRVSALEQRG